MFATIFKFSGNSLNLCFDFINFISSICFWLAFIVLAKLAVSQFINLFTLFLVSRTTLFSSKFNTALFAPIKAKNFEISSPSFMYNEYDFSFCIFLVNILYSFNKS